jgi:hypothetical protein
MLPVGFVGSGVAGAMAWRANACARSRRSVLPRSVAVQQYARRSPARRARFRPPRRANREAIRAWLGAASGVARQVNNWCRGRAAAPLWAIALAVVLQDTSPEAIRILLEEIEFAWHEILGVPPNADAAALRRAMARLARIYHPDKGGQPDLMSRVNAACERAQSDWPR